TYLAAGGVGTLGIVDDDRVDLSNLNRQILHETGDIGRAKVESARNRVEELNPEVKVVSHAMRLDKANASTILQGYDIVADGSDNFDTRFVVADACAAHGIPLVCAAVRGWEGQLSTFKPYLDALQPCYHCLVHSQPPTTQHCAENGVLGALTGLLGAAQ